MHQEPSVSNNGDSPSGGAAGAAISAQRVITVRLTEHHRVAEFCCSKSDRVQQFFSRECPALIAANYCRVFILASPADEGLIWGYYTLSPALIVRNEATGSDQKRIPKGLPIPAMRIGFLGRDDRALPGLGASLVLDAARRVHNSIDVAAWGLMLDAEGGRDNKPLWSWYQGLGFKPLKTQEPSNALYAPLKALIPELNP